MNAGLKIDFVGIGAARAGTSWIYECLREHPQICMTEDEEAGLFDYLKAEVQGLKIEESYPDVYEYNFKACRAGSLRGEYTPSYLTDPAILHLIKEHYPAAKIIVCLRNPIERLHSYFLGGQLTGKISKATSLERLAIEGAENYYIKLGFYYSQLKTVFELFPKSNVLVLITEDIVRDPTKFIQNVYRFLGVEESFVPSMANEKVRWMAQNPVKSVLLNRAIINILSLFQKKSLRPIGLFLGKVGLAKLTNFLTSVNYRKKGLKPYVKPPIPLDVRARLQEIYQPDIQNLEKLINRDLSFWK